MPRKTISREISLEGLGLHTGNKSKVVFRPAESGTGLCFTSAGFSKPIRATLEAVSGTVRGTNISDGKNTIHTVEHLLCAASALEIDDLEIEISGEEPPIADGSAKPFADLLNSAGFKNNVGTPDTRRIKKQIEVSFGDVKYKATPIPDGLTISVVYENKHPLVGKMDIEQNINLHTFISEIAPARTFGYDFELEALRAAGLARGGSLKNALVITQKEILAEGGLRYKDELVRHKLLDFIGDIALLGWRPYGVKIEAIHCGHASNVKFAKLLAEAA